MKITSLLEFISRVLLSFKAIADHNKQSIASVSYDINSEVYFNDGSGFTPANWALGLRSSPTGTPPPLVVRLFDCTKIA